MARQVDKLVELIRSNLEAFMTLSCLGSLPKDYTNTSEARGTVWKTGAAV